jgi:hypothetical protein
MKFTCEKYLIQAACAVASRATASKSTIPALEGLLLEADTSLTVSGYDLRKGIYTRIEADVAEKGSIVVGARFLGEMLRRLPDGIVSISADENLNVTVKCGRSEFNFIGISPADFPEMPAVDGVNNITVPQNILRSMINQTIFAVATSDARPIYTGTLFEIREDVLTLVSVDGYRLAKDIALWKETVAERWDAINVVSSSWDYPAAGIVTAQKYTIRYVINEQGLDDAVCLEKVNIYTDKNGEERVFSVEPLKMIGHEGNNYTFEATLSPQQAGAYRSAIRMYPKNKALPHRQDFAYVKWLELPSF